MHQKDIADNLQQWDKISRYSKWMYDVYKSHIGKRVLDIGGGVGTVINYYINNVDVCVTTELFDNDIDIMNERFKEYDYFKAYKIDITKDNIEMLKQYKFDTIICTNVIEHIENDKDVVGIMKELLIDGGKLILCAPANSKLFSYMDKNVGHYRRYDKGELVELCTYNGLKVLDNFYFNRMGMIPYYLKGKFGSDRGGGFSSDLKESNSALYNIATLILEPLEKVKRPKNGISEYVIAEKI